MTTTRTPILVTATVARTGRTAERRCSTRRAAETCSGDYTDVVVDGRPTVATTLGWSYVEDGLTARQVAAHAEYDAAADAWTAWVAAHGHPVPYPIAARYYAAADEAVEADMAAPIPDCVGDTVAAF